MLPALAQSRDDLDSLSAKLTTTALDAFIYHCKTCSALSRVLNLKNLLETFSTLHLSLHAVSCFFVISHQLETTGTQFLTVELLCPTNMLVDCECYTGFGYTSLFSVRIKAREIGAVSPYDYIQRSSRKEL